MHDPRAMEFQPKVSDFYPENAVSANVLEIRKKNYSRVKKVGNMWMIPDGQTFEKQHKAYKAINDYSRQMEYLYLDPSQRIDQFFELDIPRYVCGSYRLLDAPAQGIIRRRSFKQYSGQI